MVAACGVDNWLLIGWRMHSALYHQKAAGYKNTAYLASKYAKIFAAIQILLYYFQRL